MSIKYQILRNECFISKGQSMTEVHIIVLIVAGVGAGFATGLLGVGGGFFMVPVQFWVLKSIGIDPTIAIRIALGTNLLVVLPTALRGALVNHRRGAVVWNAGIALGSSAVIGAFLGAIISSNLPGPIMTLMFGSLMIIVALAMVTTPPPITRTHSAVYRLPVFIFWGLIFGLVSGTLGVAGGAIYLPVMVFVLKFTVHQAVATSMVTMVFSAAGGAFSFLVNGLDVEGLPPYSTGYLNWLQWGLLSAGSIPMASVGVRVAHRLKGKTIQYIFACVLIFIGLKMTSFFEWFCYQ